MSHKYAESVSFEFTRGSGVRASNTCQTHESGESVPKPYASQETSRRHVARHLLAAAAQVQKLIVSGATLNAVSQRFDVERMVHTWAMEGFLCALCGICAYYTVDTCVLVSVHHPFCGNDDLQLSFSRDHSSHNLSI